MPRVQGKLSMTQNPGVKKETIDNLDYIKKQYGRKIL